MVSVETQERGSGRAIAIDSAAKKPGSIVDRGAMLILLAYFASLYVMPYLMVRFDLPRAFAIREVLAIVLLCLVLRHIGVVVHRTPPWIWVLAVAYLLGALVAERVDVALVAVRTLGQFLAVYIFSLALVRSSQSFILGCRFFLGIGATALGMIVFQLMAGPADWLNIYPSFDEGSQRFGLVRLGTVFGNPITSCMILLVLFWQVALQVRSAVWRWTITAGLCVAAASTISIAPLVVLALSVGLVATARPALLRSMSAKRILQIAIALLLIVGAIAYVVSTVDGAMVPGGRTVSSHITAELESRFVERVGRAAEIMERRGWLLPIGYGLDVAGQGSATMTPGAGFRPHNAIMEILLTMGVLGLLAYVALFWDLTRRILRLNPDTMAKRAARALGLGVIAAFGAGLTVDVHLTAAVMVPFFYLSACMRSVPQLVKRSETHPRRSPDRYPGRAAAGI
jgi:hypothetical protein